MRPSIMLSVRAVTWEVNHITNSVSRTGQTTRKDAARMDELLADDFVEYVSSGKVLHKSGVLSAPDDGVEYALSDFSFTDFPQVVTLVKYKSVASSQAALRSSIWVQNGGAWWLMHHQATVVPNAT